MIDRPEEELPQDQKTDADDFRDVSPWGGVLGVADVPTPADPGIAKAEDAVKKGVLAAMEGSTDALHAVHTRLAEVVPFIDAAITQATGNVKTWLQALSDSL